MSECECIFSVFPSLSYLELPLLLKLIEIAEMSNVDSDILDQLLGS